MSLSTILNIILALLVFSAIIFFHELGHFLLAKKNGIFVNEFAIGMGPALFSKTYHDTKYSIRAIPMGGFCAMLGEDEASEDERAFGNKSVWARISVVIAGPLFNFIMAFLLALIVTGVRGFDIPKISQLSESGVAQQAGIQVGDIVTHFNGHRIRCFREIVVYMEMRDGKDSVTLDILRNGEALSFSVQPQVMENGEQLIGIYCEKEKGNIFSNIKYSFLELRYQIKTVFLSLKYLISGKAGVKDMSGPVGIVSMMSETIDYAKQSARGNASLAISNVVTSMMNFAILLSANLGVMNLLPFPALDGGRTVMLLGEAITRKKFPIKVEAAINAVGFILLIGLMIVVMFQDVLKIVH